MGVVVIVVLLLLFAYTFSRAQPLKYEADAVRFVLDDLAQDESFVGRSPLFSVYAANKSGEEWTVVSKITLSPNSACPEVFIRTYHLLPMRHGIDLAVVTSCHAGTFLTYPEEAIIATSTRPDARSILYAGGRACGFAVPIVAQAALEYCPGIDVSALESFAAASPGARWIAYWASEDRELLLGLSQSGAVLSESG
ncbi:hypothetical protein AUJ14_01770 [Candidatus Micrarchaeota archaeon CG1_02_55_22]|nr:MAG: hypothetical protein AUJ14_01770 [Candidatus Micrarchaeota archaeon CG1_02_55_22]